MVAYDNGDETITVVRGHADVIRIDEESNPVCLRVGAQEEEVPGCYSITLNLSMRVFDVRVEGKPDDWVEEAQALEAPVMSLPRDQN